MWRVRDLLVYTWQRVPLLFFGALAAVAVLLARWDGSSNPFNVTLTILVDILLAYAVLWQLRLWDDLVDLPQDRIHHPQRLLVKVQSTTPFVAATVLVFLANLAWLWTRTWPPHAWLLYLGLVLILAAWYGGLRHRLRSPVLHYHVILLKYPALVYLLAPPTNIPWRGMLCAYLAACVYEVAHDRQLQLQNRARTVATVEALTLSLCLFTLLMGNLA